MWTLYYAQQVVSTIYQLREKGVALREELKRLEQDPHMSDARVIPDQANMYEIEVLGYWVLFELLEKQQAIRVLNIDEVM